MPRNAQDVKQVYQNGYARMKELETDPRLPLILSLIRRLPIPKHGKILDIGCGDGSFTWQMADMINTSEVYGIDIATEAVKTARASGMNAAVRDIDEADLPFKQNTFDFIFCGNLIELVLNADHLLTEIHRVLKPGGSVIMTYPNVASWGSRLALLLGYMPFFSRVSTQYDLGKMIGGTKKGPSTGFIRLFTLGAFTELAKLHGLRVTDAKGSIEQSLPSVIQPIDHFLSQKPSLAFHLICVLEKV